MNSGYGKKIYISKKKYSLSKYLIVILFFSIICLFVNNNDKNIDNKLELKRTSINNLKQISESFSENKNIEPFLNVKTTEELEIVDKKQISPGKKIVDLNNNALEMVKTGNYSEAILIYEKLLEYDRRYLTAIGICYFRLNENEISINYLRDSDDFGFYPFINKKFLAILYYRVDNLSESLSVGEEALKLKYDYELKVLIAKIKREIEVMEDYNNRGLENFNIRFSREEHDGVREIVADFLKDAYKNIGKELDYFPYKSFTVILYSERDFSDVTRSPGWAGGLYDGKIRIPVKGLSDQNDMLRKVIFHEYTHALISEMTPKCPLWINEGLAEYFSKGSSSSTKQLIPLKFLESRFPTKNIKTIETAYEVSRSAVSYLIDKYGIYSISELLRNYKEEKDNNSAFESVFMMSYDDFLNSWGKDS